MEMWDFGWVFLLVRWSKFKVGDDYEVKGIKVCQYVFVKEVYDDRVSREGNRFSFFVV